MKVFLLFYEVENPDIVCFNTLLSACARVGDMNRALGLLARIEGGKDEELFPNVKTYGEMMKCAWMARRRDVGESLWAKLEHGVEGVEEAWESDEKLLRFWGLVQQL